MNSGPIPMELAEAFYKAKLPRNARYDEIDRRQKAKALGISEQEFDRRYGSSPLPTPPREGRA